MKSLRARLKDIEGYSGSLSKQMVGHVRNNYMKVIARKDKEINELKAKVLELEGDAK